MKIALGGLTSLIRGMQQYNGIMENSCTKRKSHCCTSQGRGLPFLPTLHMPQNPEVEILYAHPCFRLWLHDHTTCLHLRHQTLPPQACLQPRPQSCYCSVLQTLHPQLIHKCLNYRNQNHCFSSCVYTPDPRDIIAAHMLTLQILTSQPLHKCSHIWHQCHCQCKCTHELDLEPRGIPLAITSPMEEK